MDGAVDRRPADAEQLGQLSGGLRAAGVKLEQAAGLNLAQFRLLPAQPPLGLGLLRRTDASRRCRQYLLTPHLRAPDELREHPAYGCPRSR